MHFKLFTALAVTAIATASLATAEIRTFGTKQHKIVVSDIKLKPKQSRHFTRFKRDRGHYFGALAVSPSKDVSWHALGFHSLPTAIATSKAACEVEVKNG